ncbi:MAG: SGNH/GDSL hydrolase family protein [Desulfobaccales bacterium]
MRQALLKIVSIMLGLVVAFGIAEVGIRIFCPQEVAPIRFAFDPQRGEIPTPNQRGRHIMPGAFDFTYSNNSLGLRGSKEYGFKRSGEHRILFLGDSFTYGLGVNDDQTFPYLIAKHLNSEKMSVEGINAGNPGRGTDYALKFFQVLGAKFKPDLTVFSFLGKNFVDDSRGDYYSVSPEGELTPKRLRAGNSFMKDLLFHLPGYNWLVSWSQAANLVKQAGIRWYLARSGANAQRRDDLVISYPERENGYGDEAKFRLTRIYVKNLITSVEASGSSIMFFYLPMAPEIEQYRKNGTISIDEAAFTEILKKQGQELKSLTPVLAASREALTKLYFVPRDGHWTALGQALAAEYMGGEIEKRLQQGQQPASAH